MSETKFLDLTMPNGRRLGDCTLDDLENFKINDLLKIVDSFEFWLSLTPDRVDDYVENVEDGSTLHASIEAAIGRAVGEIMARGKAMPSEVT